jgi:AcrR family transcriptional regulator
MILINSSEGESMKISAEQKDENRRAILDAAVDLMIEKGFRSMTMRAVARKAGIGDATIYNYFPTKESLVQGYYMEALETAVRTLSEVENSRPFWKAPGRTASS